MVIDGFVQEWRNSIANVLELRLSYTNRVTGLCPGNSPVTGEFPAQKASDAENISIWWRNHDILKRYFHGTFIHWDNRMVNETTLGDASESQDQVTFI